MREFKNYLVEVLGKYEDLLKNEPNKVINYYEKMVERLRSECIDDKDIFFIDAFLFISYRTIKALEANRFDIYAECCRDWDFKITKRTWDLLKKLERIEDYTSDEYKVLFGRLSKILLPKDQYLPTSQRLYFLKNYFFGTKMKVGMSESAVGYGIVKNINTIEKLSSHFDYLLNPITIPSYSAEEESIEVDALVSGEPQEAVDLIVNLAKHWYFEHQIHQTRANIEISSTREVLEWQLGLFKAINDLIDKLVPMNVQNIIEVMNWLNDTSRRDLLSLPRRELKVKEGVPDFIPSRLKGEASTKDITISVIDGDKFIEEEDTNELEQAMEESL